MLVELADALSAPEARAAVLAFLQAVRADPLFGIVGSVPSVYQAGFDLFAARPDKAWSLTDCISFGVRRAAEMNLPVRRTSSPSHGATRRTGSPSYKLRMVSSILPLA